MGFKRYAKYAPVLTTSDGVNYQGTLMFAEFEYSGPVQWYVVPAKNSMRPDIIAYEWYGDASLWPFIAWFNGIQDPITGFTNIVQDVDDQGNPVFDLNGNPVMVPNEIMIPTDKSQFVGGIIPLAYQQR